MQKLSVLDYYICPKCGYSHLSYDDISPCQSCEPDEPLPMSKFTLLVNDDYEGGTIDILDLEARSVLSARLWADLQPIKYRLVLLQNDKLIANKINGIWINI